MRSYPTRALSLCLLGLCLSVGVLSCNGGGSVSTKPSEVTQLEQRAGFELLWPSSLPPGSDPKPQPEYDSEHQVAQLTYFRTNGDEASDTPVIFIFEALDPSERFCPPCPGRDSIALESSIVAGRNVYFREVRTGGGVSLDLFVRHRGVRLEVIFDWLIPSGSPAALTERMKQEANAVVRSMLE